MIDLWIGVPKYRRSLPLSVLVCYIFGIPHFSRRQVSDATHNELDKESLTARALVEKDKGYLRTTSEVVTLVFRVMS
jgi:hypothetical protein